MGSLIVSPQQLSGPFAEVLSQPRVEQSRNQLSGYAGNVGAAAMIGSRFLQSFAKSRVQKAAQGEFDRIKNLSIINQVYQQQSARNLTPEARQKLDGAYAPLIARYVQGAVKEAGPEHKKNPVFNLISQAADAIGGPVPKKVGEAQMDAVMNLLSAATQGGTMEEGQQKVLAQTNQYLTALAEKNGGRMPVLQDVVSTPEMRELMAQFQKYGGDPGRLLVGVEPLSGIAQQFRDIERISGAGQAPTVQTPASTSTVVQGQPQADVSADIGASRSGAVQRPAIPPTVQAQPPVAASAETLAPSTGASIAGIPVRELQRAVLEKTFGYNEREYDIKQVRGPNGNWTGYEVLVDKKNGDLFARDSQTGGKVPVSLPQGYTTGTRTGRRENPQLLTSGNFAMRINPDTGVAEPIVDASGNPIKIYHPPPPDRSSENLRDLRTAKSNATQDFRNYRLNIQKLNSGDIIGGMTMDSGMEQALTQGSYSINRAVDNILANGGNQNDLSVVTSEVPYFVDQVKSFYGGKLQSAMALANESGDEEKRASAYEEVSKSAMSVGAKLGGYVSSIDPQSAGVVDQNLKEGMAFLSKKIADNDVNAERPYDELASYAPHKAAELARQAGLDSPESAAFMGFLSRNWDSDAVKSVFDVRESTYTGKKGLRKFIEAADSESEKQLTVDDIAGAAIAGGIDWAPLSEYQKALNRFYGGESEPVETSTAKPSSRTPARRPPATPPYSRRMTEGTLP